MQQIPTDGISERLTDVRVLRVRPETVAQEFPIRFRVKGHGSCRGAETAKGRGYRQFARPDQRREE